MYTSNAFTVPTVKELPVIIFILEKNDSVCIPVRYG